MYYGIRPNKHAFILDVEKRSLIIGNEKIGLLTPIVKFFKSSGVTKIRNFNLTYQQKINNKYFYFTTLFSLPKHTRNFINLVNSSYNTSSRVEVSYQF